METGISLPIDLFVEDLNVDALNVDQAEAALQQQFQGVAESLGEIFSSVMEGNVMGSMERVSNQVVQAFARVNRSQMAYDTSRAQIEQIVEEYNELYQALLENEAAMADFAQTSEYAQAQTIMSAHEHGIEVPYGMFSDAEKVIAEYDEMAQRSEELRARMAELSNDPAWAQLGENFAQLQGDLAKSQQAISGYKTQMLSVIEKNVDKLIGKFRQLGSTIVNAFKKGSRSSNDFSRNLKKLRRMFLQYFLGFRSSYYLIKKLRTIFINSFKDMAKSIPEVNTLVSSLMTSINQIKGSLATAFQPLAAIVVPALNRFIAKLVEAMNTLGKFFATLTGQNYIYEYTADKVDYAAEEAEKASKKLKKSLAGFDEINQLKSNDSSSSDSGASGTWKKVATEAASSKFAEMLKKAWKDGDFEELGRYLGEKLKLTLDSATEALEGKIREMALKIANSLATFINGFVTTEGLGTSIGQTVGAAINTAMMSIDKFFTTTNWVDVGKFIADAIMGAVRKIDWANAGQTVTHMAHGILTMIKTALQNVDWYEVGRSIGTFISNIDFKQIGIDFIKIAGEIIKGIAEAITGYANENPISVALLTLFGTGLAVTKIALTVAKVLTVIKMLGPFIKLFVKLFAGAIKIAGGIALVISGLVTAFINFFNMLKNGFSWLREILMVIGIAVAAVGAVILGVPAAIAAAVAAVVAAVLTAIVVIKDHWEEIKTFFINLWNKIVTVFSNAWQKVKDTFTPILNWFKTLFQGIGLIFKALWIKFTEKLGEIKDKIKEKLQPVVDWIKDKIEILREFWVEWTTTIKGFFTMIGNKIKNVYTTYVKPTIDDIKKGIEGIKQKITSAAKSAINWVISGVEWLINKVISGVNWVIGKFNSLASWAAKIVGTSYPGLSTFGTVKLPRLAQGAVVPPNREFLAMLGDNKKETEIVSPLSTIKQAMTEALRDAGGVGGIDNIVIYLSTADVTKAIISQINGTTKQTGTCPIKLKV